MPRTDRSQQNGKAGGAIEAPDGDFRACEWPGCTGEGTHPAPRARDALRQYRWFCLEHVRAYNRSWNYYSGMSEEEVEAEVRRDTVWRRPTWRMGTSYPHAGARVHDGFGVFNEDGPESKRAAAPTTAEEQAMTVLELSPPLTVATVKARYNALVKIHHPDANGGDKASEDKFKEISQAYQTVMHSLVP